MRTAPIIYIFADDINGTGFAVGGFGVSAKWNEYLSSVNSGAAATATPTMYPTNSSIQFLLNSAVGAGTVATAICQGKMILTAEI